LVNQGRIQCTHVQLLQQALSIANVGPHGMGANALAQGPYPFKHQRVAETDLPTHVEDVVIALDQGQIPLRGFPGEHHLVGVHDENLTVGGQLGPGAVTHKQFAAKLTLQALDARGNRGLGYVHALGGRNKAAATDDFEEGACEINVHGWGQWQF